MFEKRTTIRNNFIQEKVDIKMRPVYNLGTGITGRTPIQKHKMGYTCCSILQQRNRKLKLESHKLKAREKKATQRCADLKEDNLHLNNLLKSTINSNSARVESAKNSQDHHIKQLESYAYELIKNYNKLTVEFNDQALKSKKKITVLEAKCKQFCKNVNENELDFKKKRKRQNSTISHSAKRVMENDICYDNSDEPKASNFQRNKIKCEICDEEFSLTFKLNRHLTKFHDNVEEKNPKNDDKFLTTVESEKCKKKEKVANLIRPKNPADSDSEPMLNMHHEFASNTKVGSTLTLKASKDQTNCKKNTKVTITQVEAEQPLEENKFEPGTSGLENPKFFLQDEDEVAWA